MRWRSWWACLAVLSLASAPTRISAQPAQPKPLFALAPLRGGDVVSVGAGHEPTIVAVFATWCRSCKDEVAIFNTLQNEWAPRGIRFVALSADEIPAERIARWLDAHRAAYPAVRDSTGAALRSLGVVGVPEVHVIDGNGRVVWSRRGPIEGRLAELRAALRALEGKPGTSRPADVSIPAGSGVRF